MPRTLQWPLENDATIRRMRAAGAAWDVIADSLGVSRWAVSERGRVIGARVTRTERPTLPTIDKELANPCREPLRAGHPTAWNLITAGTQFEGSGYPWPPISID